MPIREGDGTGIASVRDGAGNTIFSSAVAGGTQFIACDNQFIYEYSVSTPWDITTASYTDTSLDISSQTTDTSDVNWNDDGTKLYVTDRQNPTVYEYDVSTAWDISTATHNQTNTVPNNISTYGISFDNDGSKVYFVDNDGTEVREYNLTTNFDTGTMSHVGRLYVGSQAFFPQGGGWASADGTKYNVIDNGDLALDSYGGWSSWNMAGSGSDQHIATFQVASGSTSVDDVAWHPEGTKAFVLEGGGSSTSILQMYDAGTAFDITTLSNQQNFSLESEAEDPGGFAFNNTPQYAVA